MRRIAIAAAAIALSAIGALAAAQPANETAYVAPAGTEMAITLYPSPRFLGSSRRVTENFARFPRPFEVESIYLERGIWELCSDINFEGRCVRISGSQAFLPQRITLRSIRLVGDTGPTYVEALRPRAGPDLVQDKPDRVVENRPTPAPVVTPKVDEGGEAGQNPVLSGLNVAFFAAPARNGLRVLACSEGQANTRCVQATADGFCKEQGYRDSGWREMETVRGRAYLVNVLCKNAPDTEGARSAGFKLPGLPF